MNPLSGCLLSLPDGVSTGDCDWSPLPEGRYTSAVILEVEADYQERFARRVLSFPRRILKARSDNARE